LRKKGGPAENGWLKSKRPAWPLLAGLALVALLAAVSCGGAGKQSTEDPGGDGPRASADKSRAASEEPQAGTDLEHPSLGDEDAPVLMIEYADFQ
jgi:hypothetical protein